MPLQSPFVTETFKAYISDVITSHLSFAVMLIDEYTQDGPSGRIEVKIKEGGPAAARNLSGYFLVTDRAPGLYTVSIEADYYFAAEQVVNTPTLDPKAPVVLIVLKPNPRYPFPAGATLLRGVVVNSSPVAGAAISVTGKTITTNSDQQGEFVLYFRGIKTEAITVVIQKGSDTKSVGATIEEGKTVSAGRIPFP